MHECLNCLKCLIELSSNYKSKWERLSLAHRLAHLDVSAILLLFFIFSFLLPAMAVLNETLNTESIYVCMCRGK